MLGISSLCGDNLKRKKNYLAGGFLSTWKTVAFFELAKAKPLFFKSNAVSVGTWYRYRVKNKKKL
jgi:hypothetical protein